MHHHPAQALRTLNAPRALAASMVMACALLACLPASASSPAQAMGCRWAKPAANPYRGSVPGALLAYRAQIPADALATLRDKMQRTQPDDVAQITRDDIQGRQHRYTHLRDMHDGSGKPCRGPVLRHTWQAAQQITALVYGAQDSTGRWWHVAVPTVCNNVSLITRLDAPAAGSATAPGGTAAAPTDAWPSSGGGLQAPAEVWGAAPPAAAASFEALSGPAQLLAAPGVDDSGSAAPGPAQVWPIWQHTPGSVVHVWQPPAPPIPPVSEPGTWALFALGGLLLAARMSHADRAGNREVAPHPFAQEGTH